MIIPVSFLWKQLNGPQAKGITEAIFSYLKASFDDKLEYFNNFSIDTANDSHLTFLGLLSGFARPIIEEASHEYFMFTEEAQTNFPKGFSSKANITTGGRLAPLDLTEDQHSVPLQAETYRALLKAFQEGGEIGSLELLDNICYELTRLDIPGTAPFYTFEFMQENIPSGRAPGDVYIDIGDTSQWSNPYAIYTILNSLSKTVYSPQPQLFISIDVEET